MHNYKGFEIIWLKIATKSFKLLENDIKKRLLDKIDLLPVDASQLDIKKLEGYSDFYRIKSGDYRIVYKLVTRDKKLYISAIGHRKQIYRLLTILSKIAFA